MASPKRRDDSNHQKSKEVEHIFVDILTKTIQTFRFSAFVNIRK